MQTDHCLRVRILEREWLYLPSIGNAPGTIQQCINYVSIQPVIDIAESFNRETTTTNNILNNLNNTKATKQKQHSNHSTSPTKQQTQHYIPLVSSFIPNKTITFLHSSPTKQ
eukprot:TRINITY_DN4003_c0_g1_i2.p1 TRINITY_DN4003_c0_g1~~TRINITY_DN4003_c0_g1_i2.p1  ORF type:complete len:112 (-),score=8.69 TRINITY_DN4003_c0_g1_i2:31-366(-)